MPRASKFNFCPISSIGSEIEEHKPYVSLGKTGQIFFLKSYLDKYDAVNKFVRFFVDIDKQLIGWTLHNSVDSVEKLGRGTYRMLKLNSNGIATIQLTGAFKMFKILGKSFSKLQVEEYSDVMYNTIHYVTVPNEKSQLYPKKSDVRNNDNQE